MIQYAQRPWKGRQGRCDELAIDFDLASTLLGGERAMREISASTEPHEAYICVNEMVEMRVQGKTSNS